MSGVYDAVGNPVFWAVNNRFLQLSMYCNWRFLNLNKAFEAVVGASSRSMFVYSVVGGSSVVGNQITDLLREVSHKREEKGFQYFQPLQDKTRQDKTTLFNQDSPISCKAGILRGPGFNKTYIYTFTIKLQG